MFCAYCGTESTQGLNYCKRCGGSLNAPAQADAPAPMERQALSAGTTWAAGVTMMMLVVMGLAFMSGMIRDLIHSGLTPDAVVVIMMCGMLTILGSLFMLTRFWMRVLGGRSGTTAKSLSGARPSHTNELGPARFDALPDAPGHSVTEHTTRTLEHANKR
ncbi:MAG: hypothetical protein QOE46_1924 [Acidobacteriota bacterium]|jgi:hypothetical protein|nr:hypothetical protein [Acidobacteriota bacterium]